MNHLLSCLRVSIHHLSSSSGSDVVSMLFLIFASKSSLVCFVRNKHHLTPPSLSGRSNLLAVVGGGATPRFADNTVLVHDAAPQPFVLELTFTGPVLAVRMRRDRLIVALRSVGCCAGWAVWGGLLAVVGYTVRNVGRGLLYSGGSGVGIIMSACLGGFQCLLPP